MTGNFHPNSDIDKLYVDRKSGGRGLRSVKIMFEMRLVALRRHLTNSKNRNEIMHYIHESETDNILRVTNDLINSQNIEDNENDHSQKISSKYVKMNRRNLNDRYLNKKMHSYFRNKLEKDDNIDMEKSNSRSVNKNMTFHVEGYYSTIHDQELIAKYLKNKRERDDGKQPTFNNKCRLRKTKIEVVVHIISGCPDMSSRHYLPLHHDAVTKYLFRSHIKKNIPGASFKDNRENEFVQKDNEYEYWWNISIKAISKIPHNKPDVVIWNQNEKLCTIIEFSCPAGIIVLRKIDQKMNIYCPLLRNLQILYPEYKFDMIPIVVGALGYVPKCLTQYLCQLGINIIKIRKIIRKMQNISVSGTVRICKTFLKFNNS